MTAQPRIRCADCNLQMPDFSHARCFTCTFGKAASESSAKAREAIAAQSKRPNLAVAR